LFPILAHQKRFLERKHKKKQSGKRTGRDQDSQENIEQDNSKDQLISKGSRGATPASEKDTTPLKVTSLLDSFKERKKH
jgi:hypothetical protein